MGFSQDSTIQTLLEIVGIIVAAIIAVAVYWKQRQRKSLCYEVVSVIPLTSLHPSMLWSYQQVGLQISFKGENVPQAHIIAIDFTNNGNVPIKKEDYDVPISLSFGEKAKVLAWRWVEKKPETIQLTTRIEDTGKTIIIDPTLLNSKDNFVVEMLVSSFDKVTLGGRIVGVKEIKNVGAGLPLSREEALVDEAILLNVILFVVSVSTEAYVVAIFLLGMLALQGWRKLKLRLTRQMEQK